MGQHPRDMCGRAWITARSTRTLGPGIAGLGVGALAPCRYRLPEMKIVLLIFVAACVFYLLVPHFRESEGEEEPEEMERNDKDDDKSR